MSGIFCGKLHAWLLTQLWLITVLPSLFARRCVGLRSDLSFLDGQCLWLGQSWFCLWLSCVLASDRHQSLCLVSLECLCYMCFTVMFHGWGRESWYAPNICLQYATASELRVRFRTSKPQYLFYWTVRGRSSVAVLLSFCVGSFHMYRLFCHYLFLIFFFGASKRLYFVIVAFSRYLHVYLFFK